jgi:hypothetical protein
MNGTQAGSRDDLTHHQVSLSHVAFRLDPINLHLARDFGGVIGWF